MKKFLPTSLFSRLILVFFTGLCTIFFISLAFNHEERNQLLLRIGGQETAYRIVDTVSLLDSLTPQERMRVVSLLGTPPQRVQLRQQPVAFQDTPPADERTDLLLRNLRYGIGEDRDILVRLNTPEALANLVLPLECQPIKEARNTEHHMGMGMRMRMRQKHDPECRPMQPMAHVDANIATAYFVQVELSDEQWVTFDTFVFSDKPAVSTRMIFSLVFAFVAILFLLYFIVRWVTKPLKVLAEEADALGSNINKPPMPEKGSDEIKRAAHAFNTMQQRLKSFLEDRTYIFAAMSHDLKTPITRLRLRSEMLENESLRTSFEKDLKEMEQMVTEALAFMRGIDSAEKSQPININALLESLQEDYHSVGKSISLKGEAQLPLISSAPLLKRCLVNLIDNAIFYGKQAHIEVEDTPTLLTIQIRDEGAGIPEQELSKVFDPFYRLEQSRNRQTGGTGLGLAIARNIVQSQGGQITLSNHPHGGLQVTLKLPRHTQ